MDAFFVTLNKSEADYSPSIMYRDYPISPTQFHWESQSTTSVASPTGQRYLNDGSSVLLFVRRERSNDFGTAPTSTWGRRPTCPTPETGPSPSPGDYAIRCPGDLYASTALAVG